MSLDCLMFSPRASMFAIFSPVLDLTIKYGVTKSDCTIHFKISVREFMRGENLGCTGCTALYPMFACHVTGKSISCHMACTHSFRCNAPVACINLYPTSNDIVH